MKVAGCDAILSITGYTGSGGCEIYAANEDGDKLWKALWEAGGEYGLKNIGLGARDTLRLEKASASTATTSTTPHRPSKAAWAGLPNSPKERISSTGR